MKQLFIGLTFLTCFHSFAQKDAQANQKPETVYSIAKEEKEISWYETQVKLWKAEIDKNTKNGDAWINYYRANRALRNLAQNEEDRKKWEEACKSVHEQVWKAMPKSFEAYFIQYSQNGFSDERTDDLLKAAAIRPDDELIQDLLMIHYELQQNPEKRDFYANRLYEMNELPVGMLNWAYNILSELDENAILFTYGDNDTYAPWIVQAAKNFRKDVTVINIHLVQLDDYRNRLLKELGYAPFVMREAQTEEEAKVISNELIGHFLKGNRPAYFSASAINGFEEVFGDHLFLTGLAYKYSEASFDNTAIIRRNYEKRYLLNYLKEVFSYNIGDLKAEYFNGMYVPSMIKLHQHYSETEETLKKQELEQLLLKVAEQSGQKKEVQELLSGKKSGK